MPRTYAAVAAVLLAHATTVQAQDPVPLYPANYKVMIENDRVRVLDFRLRRGDTERPHSHPAHVLYVLEPFTIRFTLGDGRTVVRQAKAGDVLFSEAVTHSPTNIGAGDARGILIELKTPAARQAATEGTAGMERLLTAVTFIQGRPGTGAAVRRELLTLTAPTRAEPGNFAYDLYRSAEDPDRFMRLEVWRDEATLERHKATPHLRASFERRKDAGWRTEITRWYRVDEELGEERVRRVPLPALR
jgi:quinol monooxygenase YgiN/quercetin dioxygenase-like cupin family protein